jgi:Amt family ammonium transporter
VTAGYCAIATLVILKVIDVLVGLRIDAETERDGMDLAVHGEVVQ